MRTRSNISSRRRIACSRSARSASDTASFAEGLRRSLRQSPDVILLGKSATASPPSRLCRRRKPGHLVLATLHSSNVLDSLERLSRLFDVDEREGRLSTPLPAVGGHLVPEALPGVPEGRALVVEHFENQAVTRKWIMEGKFRELADFIGKGDNPANVTFLQSLVAMIQCGRITEAHGPREVAPTRANCSGGFAASIPPASSMRSHMENDTDIIEFLALTGRAGWFRSASCARVAADDPPPRRIWLPLRTMSSGGRHAGN